jgi:hypothetical protein
MKKEESDCGLLTLPPPLSPHLLAFLDAWLRHMGHKEYQPLDPASTALVLFPTVEIAKRAFFADPMRLPREALDVAIVFLAGSQNGSLKANVPYMIVGFIEHPIGIFSVE